MKTLTPALALGCLLVLHSQLFSATIQYAVTVEAKAGGGGNAFYLTEAQVDVIQIVAGDLTTGGNTTYTVTIDGTPYAVTEGTEINNGEDADAIASALATKIATGADTPTAEGVGDSSGQLTLTRTTSFTTTVGTTDTGSAAISVASTTPLNKNEAPAISLTAGDTYYFVLDGTSTSGHPFFFSTDSGGGGTATGEYKVKVTGSQATSGTIEITATSNMPVTLYYYCANHAGMGGTMTLAGKTDSDQDGMDDAWETTNSLDVGTDDSALDPDGDLLTNLIEYMMGGDPGNANNSFAALDTDGDGFSDALENDNGLDSTTENTMASVVTTLGDPDEDGLTAILESSLSLDPDVKNDIDLVALEIVDPDGDGFTSNLEDSLKLQSDAETSNLEFASLFVDVDTDADGFPDSLETSLKLDKETPTSNEAFARAVLDADGDGVIIEGLDTTSTEYAKEIAKAIVDPDGDGITSDKEEELTTDADNATTMEEFAKLVLDPDNDGFTSSMETSLGLNPDEQTSTGTFAEAAADIDGDGLLDSWETDNISQGFNPSSFNQVTVDTDRDGLSDSLETTYGSDPFGGNIMTDFAESVIDPDGDGLTSEFESIYGLDPATQNLISDLPNTGSPDQDNDGFSDSLEFNQGLNPVVATSATEFANHVIDPDNDGFTSALENTQMGMDPNVANNISDLTGTDSGTGELPVNLPTGSDSNPMVDGWFYSNEMGWLYTTPGLYPYIYRQNISNTGGVWLYFLETSSNPRYFYNTSTGNWEEY